MERFGALIEKELRHHLVVLLTFAFFLPFCFLMLLFAESVNPAQITYLNAHKSFLWVFLPLTAMVLGNRLVVVEFHGRTQLFIEALPLRRIEMLAVKYVLGLVLLLAVVLCTLALSSLLASTNEPISGRFWSLMLGRTYNYVFCVWSVFFALGLLGRYRIPIIIAGIVTVLVIESMTTLELSRFGPIALVYEPLVLERNLIPWGAHLQSFAVGSGCVILAVVLGTLNEGSLAESLSKRMSLKEKSMIGVLFVGALIAIGTLEARRTRAPFEFQEEEVIRAEGVPLEILYLHESEREDAEALSERVTRDLSSLREAITLGGEEATLPPLRLALRESLDADTFEPVELSGADGILVRANFGVRDEWPSHDSPSALELRALLISKVINETTDGRAEFEPRSWALDGFARYWAGREHNAACLEAPQSCQPLLRALWATRGEERRFSEEQLQYWLATREELGEPMARGLAFSLFLVLEHRHGRDAVIAFARALWGRQPAGDEREVLYERSNPTSDLFEETAGLPIQELFVEWTQELDRLRALNEVASMLSRIPEIIAELEVERDEGSIRHVRYRLTLEEPSTRDVVHSLLHHEIGPFDRVLSPLEHHREEGVLRAGERQVEGRLLGRYGPGVRVFFAIELESQVLGCPIRWLSMRREIQ